MRNLSSLFLDVYRFPILNVYFTKTLKISPVTLQSVHFSNASNKEKKISLEQFVTRVVSKHSIISQSWGVCRRLKIRLGISQNKTMEKENISHEINWETSKRTKMLFFIKLMIFFSVLLKYHLSNQISTSKKNFPLSPWEIFYFQQNRYILGRLRRRINDIPVASFLRRTTSCRKKKKEDDPQMCRICDVLFFFFTSPDVKALKRRKKIVRRMFARTFSETWAAAKNTQVRNERTRKY